MRHLVTIRFLDAANVLLGSLSGLAVPASIFSYYTVVDRKVLTPAVAFAALAFAFAGTALPRATNAAGNTPGLPIDAVRATPVRVSGVPSPRMRPVHHSPLHCSSCRRCPLRNARSPA